jgi:hypothetical protein
MKNTKLTKTKLLCIVVLWCISSFTTHAQLDYKMAGPFKVVARDGEFRASKGGSERDMKAAFDLANIYSNKKGFLYCR